MYEIDQPTLKSRLLYAPRKGVFYWIEPGAGHSDLVGEEAGTPTEGRGGKSYHAIQIDGRKHRRSRLAVLYMTGHWPSEQVDHINGNSLDDRWINLREATQVENSWNHKTRHKKNSHLPMGVRETASGKYAARIAVRRTQIQIGTFATVAEAQSAYQAARGKYYGQFA